MRGNSGAGGRVCTGIGLVVGTTLRFVTGGGWLDPAGLRVGSGGGFVVPEDRRGSSIPVAGAFRARRGGSGGKRRPHAWHAAISSEFSALQNGQNLI